MLQVGDEEKELVRGARMRDMLTGQEWDVRAKMVVNATGGEWRRGGGGGGEGEGRGRGGGRGRERKRGEGGIEKERKEEGGRRMRER